MDNDTVVLATGEKDLNKLFEMLKEKMPLPEEMKEPVLQLFTYILSM